LGAVRERTQTWAMRTAVFAAVGLMLGFAIGWWIWPVQYTNTAPDVLRQDYRDDYVVMVATAHEVEQDLEQARTRLNLLDPEEPSAPVVELAERIVEVGGSAEDIAYLVRLAWALGSLPPTLTPYLDGRP
jgi:predicted Co/Zn/Cd cation transporter (cation efflux family)